MSQQARDALVGQLVFQAASQKGDLESTTLTQTGLIALLLELTGKRWHIEITSVRTDHRDDSGLGLHSHANGYCADLWPLRSATPADYMDAADPNFADFLADAAASPWLYQVGLAGSANTPANLVAAGPTAFVDDGAVHIHLGAI